MASARIAQILNQRSKFSAYGKFGGSTRIGVASLAQQTSSIAKKAVSSELEDKVQKYNDGQISNDEMRAYLGTMQTSPLLSSAEKVDISGKIRDFDDRINVDKLTAVYKAAPDNSETKIAAANAVANFYKGKAGALQVDTPAYSTALQNASQWENTAVSTKDAMEKSARKYKRAVLMNEVAQATPNSIEEAQQKSQAYMTLAQQAQNDGDVTEAVQFQTQAQNAQNEIPQIQARLDKAVEVEGKQQTAAERADIINVINQVANAYHDGKISAQEFAQAIPELESRAVGIADTSIQLTLNRWADTLAKDVAKGVKRGSLEGLPVVLGKGGAGAGGAQTTWDKQDFDYSDNIRLAKAALDAGKINAKKYAQLVGKSIEEHSTQLGERIQSIYDIAQENPNQKVVFEGKKQRAADILESLYKQEEAISGQVSAYENGTFAVAMVAPNQFTKGGDIKKNGKNVATFEIIDTGNLPEGQYIQDKQGIYHKIQKDTYKLKPSDLINVQGEGEYAVYIDPNDSSKFYSVKKDGSGNPYIERGSQFANVYDPGSSKFVKVEIQPGMKQVDDYATLTQKQTQVALQKEKMIKTASNQPALAQTPQPGEIGGTPFVQKLGQKIATGLGPNGQIVKTAGDIANTVKDVVSPVTDAISKVVAPVSTVPKEVGQSADNIPQGTRINMPPISMPQAGQVAQPRLIQPTLSLAVPKQNAVQSLATRTPTMQNQKIAAPTVPKNVVATAKPKDYSIGSSLNALKNNALGLASKIFKF